MILKLNTTIKSMKGEELEMSYPTIEQIQSLPKTADGKPDRTKLPKETTKNILLDALAYYQPKDRKQIFTVYSLGHKIQECGFGEIEIEDSYKTLLLDALEAAVAVENPDKTTKGIYQHWAVAQTLAACNLLEDFNK